MHRELFALPAFTIAAHHVGPVIIYTYGFMLAIAFLAGIVWAAREARAAGIEPDAVLDCSIWIILLSIALARLFFIVDDVPFYLEKPMRILMIREGGLSYHGGVIGGCLAVIL
jgi:phosphatidylglycerol---prolipoprotein diacylglyceryl transferase